MNISKLFFCFTAMLFITAANVFADVKIKTRNTVAGQTTESTVYIKGKRQRSEQDFGGLKTVQLTQCDLRREVQLNTQAKTYFISFYETNDLPNQTSAGSVQNQNPNVQNDKGGVVTTTVTLKDTGERKQMFGYTARRIISRIETISSPDACSPVNTKMETDGWYIDADFALDCLIGQRFQTPNSGLSAGCRDRQIFKQNGEGKLGYPVYLKTTMRGEKGEEDFVNITEVTEISPAALDAVLFEIPAGFREVKNRMEIFTGGEPDAGDGNDEDPDENRELNRADLSRMDINENQKQINFGITTAANAKAMPIRSPKLSARIKTEHFICG